MLHVTTKLQAATKRALLIADFLKFEALRMSSTNNFIKQDFTLIGYSANFF